MFKSAMFLIPFAMELDSSSKYDDAVSEFGLCTWMVSEHRDGKWWKQIQEHVRGSTGPITVA